MLIESSNQIQNLSILIKKSKNFLTRKNKIKNWKRA